MIRITLALLAGLATTATTATLGAQTPTPSSAAVATIDPGMTREQVVGRLGPPLSARSFEHHTYLLYRNGCEKKCGMNDLVVLDSGKVIDAVFRSPGRRYTGTSSSPRTIPPAEARAGAANQPGRPLAVPKPPRPASKPPRA